MRGPTILLVLLTAASAGAAPERSMDAAKPVSAFRIGKDSNVRRSIPLDRILEGFPVPTASASAIHPKTTVFSAKPTAGVRRCA